uniref:Uncharacterized protein n=2 Tax=Mesangiospermae TaxID=1437183 RepID=M0S4Q9_MUSAM
MSAVRVRLSPARELS